MVSYDFSSCDGGIKAWCHWILHNDNHHKGSLKEKNIFFKLMGTDMLTGKE